MARRSSAPRDAIPPPPVGDLPARGPDSSSAIDFPLTTAALVAIFVARWTTPTEGAVLGETLWIAAWSALLPALWCLERWWKGTPSARVSRVEWAIGLMSAGPLVSGAWLLAAGGGDRRAAVNLMCEWFAFGATAAVLWRCLAASRAARGALVVVAVSLGGALAGLGCVQHFDTFPRQAEEYRALRARMDELTSAAVGDSSAAHASAVLERQSLARELEALGVPDDPGTLLLWENRLLHSREPLGLVALANTFAGLLLVVVFLGGGLLVRLWTGVGSIGFGSTGSISGPKVRSTGAVVLLATVVLVATVCLVLTKSRTAYVGATLAAVLGLLAALGARRLSTRGLGIAIGGGVAGAGVLIALLAATGGLDRLVVMESAKSLRYRLEWWTGSLAALGESPATFVAGFGPGNFRQRYLAHKLPQSSEEIADPHNMVLDVWSNGGLLGLAGLAVVGWLMAGRLVATLPSRDQADRSGHVWDSNVLDANGRRVIGPGAMGDTPADFRVVVGGLVTGVLATYLATADERVAAVGLAAMAVVLCWSRCPEGIAVPQLAAGLAGLALSVHLLGAGGIAMPAVQWGLLLCGVLLFSEEATRGTRDAIRETPSSALRAPSPPPSWFSRKSLPSVGEKDSSSPPWRGVCLGMAGCAAIVLCGQWPLWSRSAAVAAGDAAIRTRADFESAAAAYARAGRVDPLSTEGPLRESQVRFEQWRDLRRKGRGPEGRDSDNAEGAFAAGDAALAEVLSRDPRNAHFHELAGSVWLEHWRATGRPDSARRSAAAYDEAARRYPNHGRMQADRAEALAASGADPTPAARKALELDDLARKYGHRDKELSAERRAAVERLLADRSGSDPGAGARKSVSD